MAKIIILEGLERTGKTSITQKLIDKGFISLSISNKEPFDRIKNMPDYYMGIHAMTNAIFNSQSKETFILDRHFLSELVFSEWYKRDKILNWQDIDHVFENNEVTLVYLYNEYEDYISRGPKNLELLTEERWTEQKNLFDKNFKEVKERFPDSNVISINTSINDLNEVTDLITEPKTI